MLENLSAERITMKKLLLPIVFGFFALPAAAMKQQLVEAWNENLDLPETRTEAFDSYNINTNFLTNETFNGIFNVAYRTSERYGDMPGWVITTQCSSSWVLK